MATFTERILLQIETQVSGALAGLQQLETQGKQADRAVEGIGRSANTTGGLLKGTLVAGAVALVSTGLVTFLQDSVTAYADAAKGAADMANATGSSVDEVSRLTAALQDSGVTAEQTAALLGKFTANINSEKGVKALQALNVELVKNADGSTNYVATMVKVVDAIGDIGDAAQRTDQLVALFGKQGARVFEDLYNSGVDLGDAMAVIEKYRIFDAEDVKRAMAYDDAMDKLAGTMQGLKFELGQALVPAISAIAGALAGFIDVMLKVPDGVYLAVAAVIAFRSAMMTTMGASLVAGAASALTGLGAAFGGLTASMASARAGMVAMRGALVGLATAAGPLLALMAVLTAITEQMKMYQEIDDFVLKQDNLNLTLEQQAEKLKETDSVWHSIYSGWQDNAHYETEIIDNTKELARETLEAADATDAQKDAAQRYLDVIGDGSAEQQRANAQTTEGVEAQREYVEAVGGAQFAMEKAASAQQELNDAVAQYLTAAAPTSEMLQEIADSAIAANDAATEQKRVTNLAEIAMEQYATSIQGAVKWLDRLAGNTINVEEGLNTVQTSLEGLDQVVDDASTKGNEVKIETAKAQQNVNDLVLALAESGLSDEEIIEVLVGFQEDTATGKDADTVIQTAIDSVKGKDNEVPIGLKADQADIDGLAPEVEEGVGDVTIGLVPATAEAKASIHEQLTDEPVTVDVQAGQLGEAKASIHEALAEPITVPFKVSGLSEQKGLIHSTLAGEKVTVPMVVSGISEAKAKIHSTLTSEDVTIRLAVGNLSETKGLIHSRLTNEDVTIQLAVGNLSEVKSQIHHYLTWEVVTVRVQADTSAARSAIASLPRTSAMSTYLEPTADARAAGAQVMNTTSQTINITVPGSGSPAVTAREIDRYLRRSGNPALASVTG